MGIRRREFITLLSGALQLFETGPRCDSLFRSFVSAAGEAILGRRRDTHQLVLAPAGRMNRGWSARSAGSAPRSRFVNASLAFIEGGERVFLRGNRK
jgi:hypothetical protein